MYAAGQWGWRRGRRDHGARRAAGWHNIPPHRSSLRSEAVASQLPADVRDPTPRGNAPGKSCASAVCNVFVGEDTAELEESRGFAPYAASTTGVELLEEEQAS